MSRSTYRTLISHSPRIATTHRAVAGMSAFLMLTMVLGIVTPSFLLVSLAACSLLVLLVPFWGETQLDWFSMWNWVVYSSFIGVFLRSIYITFDIPSSSAIQGVFLLGKPKEFLLWPMVAILIALICLTVGYISGPRTSRRISLRVFRSERWNGRRLELLILVLLAISWVAIILFVDVTGGLTIERLSGKRSVAPSLLEYRARGYLRWGASLAETAGYLLVARIVSRKRIWHQDVLLLILSLGASLFFAVYASSRGGVLFILVNLLAIAYYLHGRLLSPARTMAASIVGLFMLQLLTYLRRGQALTESVLRSMDLLRALEPAVLGRNFIDVSKTAHIMMAIPDVLGHQYGKTLVSWLIAWIPREIWTGKPIISLGQILGPTVFGASEVIGAGGTPPGVIAELYWNFSYPGVLVGCFALGYVLKLIYINFDANSSNRNVVLLYVTSFMTLGMWALGSSVTGVITASLQTFVPLYIALHIITDSEST